MSIWEAIVLGLVQGLTEFLPVSSSGHLVIVGALLGVQQESLAFGVIVHFATLIAVLIALKDDWYPIVLGLLGRGDQKIAKRRLVAVAAGSLPVALAGLLLENVVERLFGSPAFAAAMLLVTGAVLWLAAARAGAGGRSLDEVGVKEALLIGCGQAFALVPGISRSGSTMAAGVFAGLEQEAAARFSFLLAIPAILGAALLELPEIVETGTASAAALAAGAAAAGVSGYAAIALFLRLVKRGTLRGFAVYTWMVGIFALWLVLGR